MKFGIKSHGRHSVIKLNVKIRKEDMIYLLESYEDLYIYEIGKGLTRIEGCLKQEETEFFMDRLKQACIEYKIEELQRQNWDITNKYAVTDIDAIDDLNIL